MVLIRKALPAFGIAAALSILTATGIVIALSGAQEPEPEPSRTLTPGKGSDLTTARCATCHDAQHITRAKLSRGEWEFNIKNMIERGAPVAPDEIPVILEYLATYYNRDTVPPPPDPSAAAAGMSDTGQGPVARLLNANACVACHQVDRRVVGPSFKEVAAKFASDGDAVAKLSKKIREGGSGNWGNVPMPPNPALSDAELRTIVDWVLALKQ